MSRRKDAQKRMVHKYRLPELNPNYYITAMDLYMQHFKKKDPLTKVNCNHELDTGLESYNHF